MEERTPDGTPTVDLGPSEPGVSRRDEPATGSAFDPPRARFEAIGELGRGGMGRVDDAYDHALGRPVAIKHMLSTSAIALGRFEREARITARLEHPGIVPIHDAGRGPDGTPYYVMRRVDGQPVDAKITAVLAERLALIPNVLAACDAVAFAHARGIIHRDIKPTNILIGPFGETLVIDWGLAREIGEIEDGPAVVEPSDPQLTVAGTVAGTPGFMAPEQARGEAVDARADVFALGATLFYVLSGQLPYGSASATEMVDLAGAGREPNWRAIPRDVPPELRAIAAKAMASEAAERYPDAGALAADLRRFITGNLVGAYEYGPLARFVRFVRRHRAAVAVALVSAVIVGVIAVLSVRRIVSERDDATTARALAETRQLETASMRDHLLIEHAIELANTDPIAAIATLRTLAPESTRWREAHAAAAQAYVRGIPFGFEGTGFGIIQVHRDSKRAAVGYGRGGKIAIIDLLARTKQVLPATCDPLQMLAWLGASHLVCSTSDTLVINDIVTGHKRTLPIDVAMLYSDHGTKLWIVTRDSHLLELDAPDGEPREIASGFDRVDVSPLLDEALFRRGANFEVWSGSDRITFTIATDHPDQLVATIRDHRIAMLDNLNVHAYRIEAGRVIPIEGIKPRRYISAEIIGNKFYLESPEGQTVYQDNQDFGTRSEHGTPFTVLRGLVRVTENGATLIDRDGEFRIERRSSPIRKLDVSLDGRFVVTLSDSGEIVVWDLAAVRPRRIWLDNGTSIARLTKHFLWSIDMFEGIKRTSLETGEVDLALPAMPTGQIHVAEDETWVAIQHQNETRVLDTTTQHRLALATTMACDDGKGIVFVKADRTLWRWRPGKDEATLLGSLEQVPNAIAASPDFTALHLETTVMLRRSAVTGAIERASFPLGSRFGMLDNGTVWIRRPDGAAFRWDLGRQPVQVDIGGQVDDLVVDHDRVALYSGRSLTLVIGDKRYISPLGSSTFGWAGRSTAITTNASGEPVITDLLTGLGYKLPTRAVINLQPPIGNENTFAITVSQASRKAGIDLWTVDVPEDPIALRAWLATITNATAVAGTTSYRWPP